MQPDRVIERAIKQASDSVSSLRRQAPAARMIGEFAVKQLLKEMEKISRQFSSNHQHRDNDSNNTPQHES